ncbi:osmoprotectant transport system ATP-binding protein [Anaerobacterium chartisolvens]|uniref:Quaternary amine transport ATP-binding protein n=1 Tax=Anaerobacterium chartisolvens TaxID=1297424 RepID=A0A369BK58_9FIRM|nr:ABC transporter ATP-binding protein [Anaerobacterium chartisolvens]RCX20998.1 osmoprotectant transport system ATP-binding protein [Anaerobacterium chartisolvens]
MVKLKNVRKVYNKTTVIDEMDLEIDKGKFVVLIGPSGCGKTTTLKMINRLIEPTSGSIFIDGEEITKVNPVLLRRKIGYVIQQIGLFPNMTIAQNIEVVPRLLKWPSEKRKKRTRELLELVGMDPDEYINRYPSELSGGQQQRIGVLRALAVEPPLILMDEPFGALDPITRETLQDEVKKIQKKLNKTVVFVTHDMDEALKMADIIVIMKDGKIIQMDSPEELLANPANDFVAEFIGKHRLKTDTELQTVEDVMKPNVVTVLKSKGTAESISLMRQKNVDSLIVTDDNGRLEGVVTIDKIRELGKTGKDISGLVERGVPVVKTDAEAKTAFDMLITGRLGFVIAVDDEGRVKGIVTKTSMVKALADIVWKGNENG